MGRILFEEGIYKKTFPVSTTAHLKERPRIHIRLMRQEEQPADGPSYLPQSAGSEVRDENAAVWLRSPATPGDQFKEDHLRFSEENQYKSLRREIK